MPISPETLVNTYTLNFQNSAQTTVLEDGGWVITWYSYLQDGSHSGVFSQRYNADGTTLGDEFQVNTHTDSVQFQAETIALSDGGWVTSWASINQDGNNYGVFMQAYNADGSVQGGEVQVNTYTNSTQNNQQMAALSDGGWVVTWQSANQDGSSYGVFAQAYNADGSPQGDEFQVNTYTTRNQTEPQITALANGGWVITWQSADQDGSNSGVFAQAYNFDGTTVGDEVQVNTFANNNQDSPQITALSNGNWVVTWQSTYQADGVLGGIYAQVFTGRGDPRGAEIHVNTTFTGSQASNEAPNIVALTNGGWVVSWLAGGDIRFQAYHADGRQQGGEVQANSEFGISREGQQITALSDGGWVVTWQVRGLDGDEYDYGIYARAYNADGTSIGDEFLVNTTTDDDQTEPQIVALDNGGWVITWTSDNQDGNRSGVYSRTYEPLSADDIEVTIAGTQVVGETLTANIAGIPLDDPNILIGNYTWIIDGQIVQISSSNTFALTADHAGGEVSVALSISDVFFDATMLANSVMTDPIGDGNNDPVGDVSLESDNATSTGLFEEGDTVSVNTSLLVDGDGLNSFEYQWMLDGEAITGATAAQYQITAADEGRVLSVELSYTDGAGFDETVASLTATIAGFNGVDLSGTNDNDFLIGSTDNDRLDGLAGQDILVGDAGNDELIGNDGNDRLYGQVGDDTLLGGSGNDRVFGGAGGDFLSGGDGVDWLHYNGSDAAVEVDLGRFVGPAVAAGGIQFVNGGDATGDIVSGFENVSGSRFDDTLTGDIGRNVIVGGAGHDTLFGGDGNDILRGGRGADEMYGGEGADWLDYTGSGAGILIDLQVFEELIVLEDVAPSPSIDEQYADGGDASGDLISGFENVRGSAFDDQLHGNEDRNVLQGEAGDDTLFGGGGNDVLRGGAGQDELYGGDGNDWALYTDADEGVFAGLESFGPFPSFSGTGSLGEDILVGIENLRGSRYDDVLIGDGERNFLFGDSGTDQLIGGGGNDVLRGGSGADYIDGGDGVDWAQYAGSSSGVFIDLSDPFTNFGGDATGDVLFSIENVRGSDFSDFLVGNDVRNILNGGDGADQLSGGLGADALRGGAGADAFIFDSTIGSGNVDRILDFAVNEDVIILEAGIFDLISGGAVLDATQFAANADGLATDADQHILYNTATGDLSFDADGNGAGGAILFARLDAGLNLTAADFSLHNEFIYDLT